MREPEPYRQRIGWAQDGELGKIANQHYRHLAKLTQEQLADKVDASETYIRKLESGDRLPSLDMLLKLSSALNTTPNHHLLSSSALGRSINSSILDLLSDCTPTEFFVLYENMVNLKELLREKVT